MITGTAYWMMLALTLCFQRPSCHQRKVHDALQTLLRRKIQAVAALVVLSLMFDAEGGQ
jgi:hypothetical protein